MSPRAGGSGGHMKRRDEDSDSRLVYSTEWGKVDRAESKRRTGDERKQQPKPKQDGVVRITRETKGRKGKGVTLVTGVPLDGADLARLGKELKKKCGSGGTVKNAIIEIQGDHRDLVVELLGARGWTVKRAGG